MLSIQVCMNRGQGQGFGYKILFSKVLTLAPGHERKSGLWAFWRLQNSNGESICTSVVECGSIGFVHCIRPVVSLQKHHRSKACKKGSCNSAKVLAQLLLPFLQALDGQQEKFNKVLDHLTSTT